MRPHFSINVKDVPRSVDFYRRVFGVPPQKQTSNYAKFDLNNPSLNFSMQSDAPEKLSRVNHFGIEVDFPEEVSLWQDRLEKEGVISKPETNTECCFARQDKIWFDDPDGNSWEVFYVYEQLPVPENKSGEELKKQTCCGPKSQGCN